METQEAIKFVRALADGLHPETGQPLPEDSVCRTHEAIKALNRSLAALTAQQQREQNRPMNAGRYWSQPEDAQVCEEVRKGMDFTEIAKTHNRTVPAIVARLVKLGKIVPEKPKSQPQTEITNQVA